METVMKSWITAIGAMVIMVGSSIYSSTGAQAAEVKLTLQNHQFTPAMVKVPANQPVTLIVTNKDATPAEFESKTLRLEKTIKGGATVSVQVRALAPGRYRFFDDYHEDTTEGYLVAE
jgi:plastocyanin